MSVVRSNPPSSFFFRTGLAPVRKILNASAISAPPREIHPIRRLICYGLLATLLACHAQAAPRNELRFTDARTLPGLGIQLRAMAGARERPLPTPNAYPYTVTTPTGQFKTEMYDPRELWVGAQQAAEWEDGDGNRLTIAQPRTLKPGPFTREHVMREEYDAALAEAPAVGADASLHTLSQWMEAFCATTGAEARPLTPPSPRFTALAEFTFPPAASNLVAYAFRLNPRTLGQSRAPTNWIAAVFRLGPGGDPRRARQAVQSRFLLYVTAAQASAGEPLAPAARFQSAAAAATNVTDAFLASKQQAAASIANLKNWWYVATENYILLSNLAVADRNTIRQMQSDIETLRDVYRRLIPPRVPIRAVSVIRMPATEEEYLDSVGPEYQWTGGIWMPTRRELILRPMDESGGHERRQTLLRAVYHESFHQYLYYAYDQIEASLWYNEGHAALFETVNLQGRGVQVLESKAMAAYVQQLLQQRSVSIPDVLKLDMAAFYSPDQETRLANYALAWALVYYLRNGIASDRDSPYAGLLDRYADLLWETRNERAATEGTFQGVDLTALGSDFRAFWLSPKRRQVAERMWLEKAK